MILTSTNNSNCNPQIFYKNDIRDLNGVVPSSNAFFYFTDGGDKLKGCIIQTESYRLALSKLTNIAAKANKWYVEQNRYYPAGSS